MPTCRTPGPRRDGAAPPIPPATALRLGVTLLAALAATGVAACSLTPRGLDAERAALRAARPALAGPASAEQAAATAPRGDALPVPADGDDWRALLRRGLLANGEVHAAWFEWKAAVESVRGAAAWPNANLAFGYSYAFSDDNVKTFDRMSFDVGINPMENLSWPGKAVVAGRAALADAKAAGERLRAAKFSVQRRLLDAWLDLALAAEERRLAESSTVAAGLGQTAGLAQVAAGADSLAALAAGSEAARRDDAAAAARAAVDAARARVAALAAFDDPARVPLPTRLPAPRELPADDAAILAAASDAPDAAEWRASRTARAHDEDLAGMQWIPDVNPAAAFTGGIEQAVGAMVMLPTAIAKIRSAIDVSRAMRRAAGAKARQASRDAKAEARALVVEARDAARARDLLDRRVLPLAELTTASATAQWTAGNTGMDGVVEAALLELEVRTESARAAIQREKAIAALEETLGADVEALRATAVALRHDSSPDAAIPEEASR